MTPDSLFLGLLAPLLFLVGLIDQRTGRIPNALNLAIAALGAARALSGGVGHLQGRLVDALIFGLLLLLLRHAHSRWRGRIGLGLGDVKFLGAATLWLGLPGMPATVLIACLSGLATAGAMKLSGARVGGDTRLRFGPHLAGALFLALLLERVLSA